MKPLSLLALMLSFLMAAVLLISDSWQASTPHAQAAPDGESKVSDVKTPESADAKLARFRELFAPNERFKMKVAEELVEGLSTFAYSNMVWFTNSKANMCDPKSGDIIGASLRWDYDSASNEKYGFKRDENELTYAAVPESKKLLALRFVNRAGNPFAFHVFDKITLEFKGADGKSKYESRLRRVSDGEGVILISIESAAYKLDEVEVSLSGPMSGRVKRKLAFDQRGIAQLELKGDRWRDKEQAKELDFTYAPGEEPSGKDIAYEVLRFVDHLEKETGISALDLDTRKWSLEMSSLPVLALSEFTTFPLDNSFRSETIATSFAKLPLTLSDSGKVTLEMEGALVVAAEKQSFGSISGVDLFENFPSLMTYWMRESPEFRAATELKRFGIPSKRPFEIIGSKSFDGRLARGAVVGGSVIRAAGEFGGQILLYVPPSEFDSLEERKIAAYRSAYKYGVPHFHYIACPELSPGKVIKAKFEDIETPADFYEVRLGGELSVADIKKYYDEPMEFLWLLDDGLRCRIQVLNGKGEVLNTFEHALGAEGRYDDDDELKSIFFGTDIYAQIPEGRATIKILHSRDENSLGFPVDYDEVLMSASIRLMPDFPGKTCQGTLIAQKELFSKREFTSREVTFDIEELADESGGAISDSSLQARFPFAAYLYSDYGTYDFSGSQVLIERIFENFGGKEAFKETPTIWEEEERASLIWKPGALYPLALGEHLKSALEELHNLSDFGLFYENGRAYGSIYAPECAILLRNKDWDFKIDIQPDQPFDASAVKIPSNFNVEDALFIIGDELIHSPLRESIARHMALAFPLEFKKEKDEEGMQGMKLEFGAPQFGKAIAPSLVLRPDVIDHSESDYPTVHFLDKKGQAIAKSELFEFAALTKAKTSAWDKVARVVLNENKTGSDTYRNTTRVRCSFEGAISQAELDELSWGLSIVVADKTRENQERIAQAHIGDGSVHDEAAIIDFRVGLKEKFSAYLIDGDGNMTRTFEVDPSAGEIVIKDLKFMPVAEVPSKEIVKRLGSNLVREEFEKNVGDYYHDNETPFRLSVRQNGVFVAPAQVGAAELCILNRFNDVVFSAPIKLKADGGIEEVPEAFMVGLRRVLAEYRNLD